ncbi:IclR family transcriptional regulator [Phytoactinopolyspora endophytica]|uniref:IclR family transcriptional regulator n=1 Tax=Phytoactinopolyspora endophytica TaxID=1642495 RepID=UPI00197C1F92|nr:IclR family transcriptional regulator [Phytoactinopolyspora endophytica]
MSPKSDDESRVVGAERVLVVLHELAQRPDGAGLDELHRAVGGSKPTIHRALGALRRIGFASQDERGRYMLGDEFLRLAFAHHEQRPEQVRIRPVLEMLTERFGETAHYAVLAGREIVYRAKVDPSSGAVKLTSEIGGRNPAHATGVGKLLLSFDLPTDQALRDWVRAGGLPRRTTNTITTCDAFVDELARIRAQGYAVDDQENEDGVACVAVPVWLTSPSRPSGAVSVSAVAYRTPLHTLVDAVDEIRSIIEGVG